VGAYILQEDEDEGKEESLKVTRRYDTETYEGAQLIHVIIEVDIF